MTKRPNTAPGLDVDPDLNLEDAERAQLERAEEEDEGVNYDDELDLKRVLDETRGEREGPLPSEKRRGRNNEETSS